MHREDINNVDDKNILLNYNNNDDDDEIDEPIISKSTHTSSSSSSSVLSDIASSSATSSHDIATISIDTIGTTVAFNNIHKVTISNNEYDDGSNNLHVVDELVNSITNTTNNNNDTIDGDNDVNQNNYDLSNINHFLSLNSSLAYKNDDNNEEEEEVDEPINGIFTNTLIAININSDHKDDDANSNNDSKGSSGMVGDHILTAVDDDDDDDNAVVMMTEGSIVIPTNNYNMMNVNNTDSTTTNNNNDNSSNYIIPSYCSTEFTEAMSAVTTDCWDISSWLICLEEAEQGRSGTTTVIDIYEQIVQKFPRSAKFWKNLTEYHLSNNCMELAEEVMKKSVTVCRSVDLWVMYLNYVVGLYNDIINNKVSATSNASTTSTASNAISIAATTTNIASSNSTSIKSMTECLNIASELLRMTPTTTTTTTTNIASLAAGVVNNSHESILQIRRRCETIFEEACNNVGYSIHAYSIWRLYINFIKSWQEVGMIESGKKLHTLRSTYQRAICVCMEQSDEIWNEYETFEKQQKSNNNIHSSNNNSSSNSDQALENYLHDFNRKFLHAKSITRERKRLMHGILFDRLASPSTTSNYELQQLDLWNAWIK